MRRSALLMLLAVAAAPAAAQSVVAPAALEVLAEPDGNMIARLRAGGSVSRGASRGGFTAVTLDGWLDSTAVRAARGGPWTLIVRTRVTLRAEPQAGATPVAELPQGMGLRRVATRGRWVQVRREGWVLTRRLLPEVATRGGSGAGSAGSAGSAATGASRSSSAATTVGGPPGNQSPAAATAARNPANAGRRQASPALVSADTSPASQAPPVGAVAAARPLVMRESPDVGRELGSLAQGTVAEPLARDRGWVKVRVEGWVREADVTPADSALRGNLTAADLRADPEGTRGRVVRWDVEFLALREADPLRKELNEGETYILARGPGAETTLLYLVVPPALRSAASGLAPLAPITVAARVRSGRSDPVGIPILDIVSLTRR